MLRVRAQLRRRDGAGAPAEVATQVSFGVLQIDRSAHRVLVEAEEVLLTALEFRLLDTFLQRRGRVQTRERLLSDVWGIDADVTTRTVDTHVKRLRHKIGAASAYIETLGCGLPVHSELPRREADFRRRLFYLFLLLFVLVGGLAGLILERTLSGGLGAVGDQSGAHRRCARNAQSDGLKR